MNNEALPFDIDMARGGWPILFKDEPVTFVGVKRDGSIVVEGLMLYVVEASALTMPRSSHTSDLRTINEWFGLTYSQFLVVPRVIMEAMPLTWQYHMTTLLERMSSRYDWQPADGHHYYVRVGNSLEYPYQKKPVLQLPDDDLCDYRHPKIGHRRRSAEVTPDSAL